MTRDFETGALSADSAGMLGGMHTLPNNRLTASLYNNYVIFARKYTGADIFLRRLRTPSSYIYQNIVINGGGGWTRGGRADRAIVWARVIFSISTILTAL